MSSERLFPIWRNFFELDLDRCKRMDTFRASSFFSRGLPRGWQSQISITESFLRKHLLSVFDVAASDPPFFSRRPKGRPYYEKFEHENFFKKELDFKSGSCSFRHFVLFRSMKDQFLQLPSGFYLWMNLTELFGFEINGGFPKWNFPFFEIYFVRLIATPINYLSIW